VVNFGFFTNYRQKIMHLRKITGQQLQSKITVEVEDSCKNNQACEPGLLRNNHHRNMRPEIITTR
jgi:hypothetical protein